MDAAYDETEEIDLSTIEPLIALPSGLMPKTKKDKWGLPVLKIDCATGENERLMRKDMVADMAEMLEQCGVKKVEMYDNGYFPGMGIHEMGTARMGRDPKTSVLNGNNQVWDAPNVFVTDGACMTSAACQNPSLYLHGAHRAGS